MPLPRPEDRPVTRRTAVRVVLLDGAGPLLLFRDSDPGAPDVTPWWCLPGGGVDPGETPATAAVRELHEETGLVLPLGDLAGPIAHRVVLHGYSDRVTVQDELFYAAHVPRFDIDTSGHTQSEQASLLGHAWIEPTRLEDLEGEVWPACLARLVGIARGTGGTDGHGAADRIAPEDPAQRGPVELPTVEESSVPVGSLVRLGSLRAEQSGSAQA